MRAAKGHAKRRASGAAWVAKSECCQLCHRAQYEPPHHKPQSARTIDYKSVKNVDESYNEYQFIIQTDVEPWSEEIEKAAAKKAKRDAKGNKKQSVDDLM